MELLQRLPPAVPVAPEELDVGGLENMSSAAGKAAGRAIDLVVFGGSGYIGSAVVREGRKRGLKVIPLGRNITAIDPHGVNSNI